VPDLQGVYRVFASAEVQLGVGDDVIDPGADQAEGNRPHDHVGEDLGRAAPGDPPSPAEPVTGEDADQDADGVGTDRQRAEVPDTLGGTGNERRNEHGGKLTRHGKQERYSTGPIATTNTWSRWGLDG